MYAFEFHRPSSVSEAAALLAKSQGKLIAGGQTLVGAMKLRLASPGNLISGELRWPSISSMASMILISH